MGSWIGWLSTRSNLHVRETRAIGIISYIITNRITIRDAIISYIKNNTSCLAAILVLCS